ncbi:MAG TPA: glycosyltransferase family 9 protein, partial [Puia sp.]|nr:glycosyltransferase family 9 protein [Puia sp.]
MQIRRKQKIDKYIGYLLIAILLPVTRLLGITMFRDHSTEKPPRRILFIKLMGIGSLIVASDAIAAIRRKFPETRLVLLTDANIAAAIRPFGIFDEIHISHTDNLWSTATTMIRFFLRSWTWRRLWVVDLEVYSKLTTVLALLTLARNRFGFFLPPVPFRKYLNTHNISFDQSAFLGFNYQTMAGALTGDSRPTVPWKERRSRESSRPYIVLNNTCSGLAAVRRLPDPVFAAVCQWILEHTFYRVALLGGPGDREPIEHFITHTPILASQKERMLNVAGMTDSFAAYYNFLRESGVMLVSIDSGPLHIARKLGLPTISVWGPTDPANYLDIPASEKQRHLF